MPVAAPWMGMVPQALPVMGPSVSVCADRRTGALDGPVRAAERGSHRHPGKRSFPGLMCSPLWSCQTRTLDSLISTARRSELFAWVAGLEPAFYRFWRPVAYPVGSPTCEKAARDVSLGGLWSGP